MKTINENIISTLENILIFKMFDLNFDEQSDINKWLKSKNISIVNIIATDEYLIYHYYEIK